MIRNIFKWFLGSANNEIGGISSQSGASTSQPSAPGQGRTPAHRQQQYQPTISTADPMGLTHVSINFDQSKCAL